MSKPIFAITIEFDKDLQGSYWYQKTDKLTPTQEKKLNELKRLFERLTSAPVQQKLIA